MGLDTKTSTGIKDFASQLSGYNHDGYDTLWTHAKDDYCSDFENYSDKVRGSETCKSLDEYSTLVKEYCSTGDNITTTSCGDTEVVGSVIFNELAEAYCADPVNSNKEFCKCYNVVNYKTVCANKPTSVGCPEAKTKLDSIEEKLGVANATDALPCGTVCAGANVYKPDGFKSGCDITYNACIQNIDVGESNAEINAACNIDSTSGVTDGESGGSSGSSSVPTSAVEELKKTIAEKEEKEEEEAKKTNKKLLIGGGGGIVSSISCLVLLVIIVMVMSKKGGGRRR